MTLFTLFFCPLAVSYNQPKLCPNASWNPNATTFASRGTTSSYSYSVFVNINNTIYVSDQQSNRIQVWLNGSISPTRTISSNVSYPYSLFVTTSGDIYVSYGSSNGRVDKWTLNANIGIPVMSVARVCYGLFVHISDTLYCSMRDQHQIVAKSLNNNSSASTVVAGTACSGPASNMLYNPEGIFVDTNLDLYVADCGNNRIQFFPSGQLTGLTVAGNGLSDPFTLSCPTGVVLDADKYLFIVDSNNHRIIGSGPYGFRCLISCLRGGSASNQLYNPQSMAFDSLGNMFVADKYNGRIQKFVMSSNSCSKYNNM
jgi:hypothetical protein